MEIDYSINSHKRPCPRVDCRKEACICGLKYVSIPSVLGDDTHESGVAPKKGEYCNAIVKYEVNDHIYIYSKEGIPTLVEEGNISKKLEKEIEDRIAADEALQDEIDELRNSPDVVDIVATYADLMDYDTSTLGDRDVIRVLTDETHDDESSYYRWDKTNSQWVFIGAIEGYYTKDQTDNLLNGKQDKLTAGSNINIDADNVISGTYTNFTGATASTDGAQGLVPGPLAGDEDKFLKADGTWATAGSSSEGVLELNYSEYNPTGTHPAPTQLGEWLISKNVQGGQIVRLLNDNSAAYLYINLGTKAGTETDLQFGYCRPAIAFYISEYTSSQFNAKRLSLLVSCDGSKMERWTWEKQGNQTELVDREPLLDASNIRGLGESTYEGVLSAEAGEGLNTIVGAATNISGLGKVEVVPDPGNTPTLTFNQTTTPWDFEWRGTMVLDPSTPYNFSQASVGDSVWVYVRDMTGVPMAYTPEYPDDYTYELTDTAGNTINVSGWWYDNMDEQVSRKASICPSKLMLLEKHATAWRFLNVINEATYLPRTGGGPTVVQTTGTSTTDVMSQNAVTSMVFASPSDKTKIQIGAGAKASGIRSISIFNDATASSSWGVSSGIGTINLGAKAAGGARGIAIGEGAEVTNSSTFGIALGGGGATASAAGAVALGSYSNASSKGEMNIGSTNTNYGYNSSNYRLLTGVYDGQSLHDAATVAQGNTLATTAPTTSTVGVLGQLYTDTTNMHTYQCTAISGSTYTWTQRW